MSKTKIEEFFYNDWPMSPNDREWDKFEKQAHLFDAHSMMDFAERFATQQVASAVEPLKEEIEMLNQECNEKRHSIDYLLNETGKMIAQLAAKEKEIERWKTLNNSFPCKFGHNTDNCNNEDCWDLKECQRPNPYFEILKSKLQAKEKEVEELKKKAGLTIDLYQKEKNALTARVKELEGEGWISVKERLPELGDEYNVVWNFDPDEPIVTTMEFDAKNKKWIDKSGFVDSDCTDEVSEWRPLPEPPKSK